MATIPQAPGIDQTFAFYRDPYRYLSNTAKKMGGDAFRARLLLTPTICLTGSEASAFFYSSPYLIRRGAALRRIVKTLVGVNGVQNLDEAAHLHRKAMFLAILSPDRVADLAQRLDQEWWRLSSGWSPESDVVLYDVARAALMRTVCAWAEVQLPEAEVDQRAREVAALFEYAGSVGPRHWWSRWARRRCEAWMRDVLREVRTGRRTPSPASALHQIAFHRDLAGRELPLDIAAVEMLNVIRPTVAVAVYLVQAIHALQVHPDCAERVQRTTEEDAYRLCFVQEVRRFYPFYPAAMAKAREDFVWNDISFRRHQRVLLDLYGTNHDRRRWHVPEKFRPERFREYQNDAASFVPQGGGDAATTHRCPGEPLAIALMKVTVEHFARRIVYTVPEQDLEVEMTRMPALPRSRMILRGIRGAAVGGPCQPAPIPGPFP